MLAWGAEITGPRRLTATLLERQKPGISLRGPFSQRFVDKWHHEQVTHPLRTSSSFLSITNSQPDCESPEMMIMKALWQIANGFTNARDMMNQQGKKSFETFYKQRHFYI